MVDDVRATRPSCRRVAQELTADRGVRPKDVVVAKNPGRIGHLTRLSETLQARQVRLRAERREACLRRSRLGHE